MKRVRSSCICQTLHFLQKEDVDPALAAKLVKDKVAHYKATLDRNRTAYKIAEETTQADGSILLKIIKQYNATPVGDYLN